MKHTSLHSRTGYLAMTFSVMAMVFLSTVVNASTPTFAFSSSQSVSKAAAERLEKRLAQRNRRFKARSARASSLSSSTASVVSRVRPSLRALRSAAPENTEESTVRTNAVYEKAGCGDELVILPETCDDGNTVSNDGCSSTCTIETGFVCDGRQPSVCRFACGDGSVAATHETCDDGNTDNGDGCNQYCFKEPGYSCTTAKPNVCTIIPHCGNKVIEAPETCDDGNIRSDDGCSASCVIES